MSGGGKSKGTRSAKIPIASSPPERVEFESSDAFWNAVETHTGPLSSDQRGTLQYRINSYYSRVQFGRNASSVADAETRLRAILAAAEPLQALLWGKSDDLSVYVESVINRHLGGPAGPSLYYGPPTFGEQDIWVASAGLIDQVAGREETEWVRLDRVQPRLAALRIGTVSRVVDELVTACALAAKDLARMKKERHFHPSGTWDGFVAGLGDFWESISTQHRVRVPKSGGSSDFIEFVNTVQFQMSPEFREHDTGSEPGYAGDALIGAIYRATPMFRGKKGDKQQSDTLHKVSPKGTRGGSKK